jgi:hypothetical protein
MATIDELMKAKSLWDKAVLYKRRIESLQKKSVSNDEDFYSKYESKKVQVGSDDVECSFETARLIAKLLVCEAKTILSDTYDELKRLGVDPLP